MFIIFLKFVKKLKINDIYFFIFNYQNNICRYFNILLNKIYMIFKYEVIYAFILL